MRRQTDALRQLSITKAAQFHRCEARILHGKTENFYSSPNVIKTMVIVKDGMGGESSTHTEVSNAYRILIEKPEGKRSLGIPWRRWEDNIRLDLYRVGGFGLDSCGSG
jgi:hypothetical protein